MLSVKMLGSAFTSAAVRSPLEPNRKGQLQRSNVPVVTLVCHTLQAGGAEKQLLLIAKGLLELGAACDIRTLVKPVPAPSLQPLLVDLQEKFNITPKRFSIVEACVDRRADHVWWTWGRRADLVMKTLKPVLSGKLFCSLRDSDTKSMRKYRVYDRAFHHRVDRFVSNTSLACTEFARFVPTVRQRSTVLLNALPNACSQPQLAGAASPFRVAMLGNILIETKGYDILLALGELLKQNREPIVVNVAGRDESGGRFAALINERALGDYVKYVGPVQAPLSFLAGNHMFLLLSRHEGTPNALLEAMSLGLPCVSTRVGDLPVHFRHQEHLEFIEHASAVQAYEAVKRIRAGEDYARELGRAAQSRCAALFSFERLKKDLESLFWPEADS